MSKYVSIGNYDPPFTLYADKSVLYFSRPFYNQVCEFSGVLDMVAAPQYALGQITVGTYKYNFFALKLRRAYLLSLAIR